MQRLAEEMTVPDAGRTPLKVSARLDFEYERCFQRPVWPAEEGKQTASQHLDIHVDDLAAAVNWAESHGARLADFQPQDRVRVTPTATPSACSFDAGGPPVRGPPHSRPGRAL